MPTDYTTTQPPNQRPPRVPALEAALEDLGRQLSSSPGCGGKRAAMNDEVDRVLRSFAAHVGESEALCKVLDACALERHRGEIDAAFVVGDGEGEGDGEGVEGIVRRLEGMEGRGSEWAGRVRWLVGWVEVCFAGGWELPQVLVGNADEERPQNVDKNGPTQHNTTQHQTLKLLRKASPTALQVTLRALRAGRKMPLEETFPMEYRLSQVGRWAGILLIRFDQIRSVLLLLWEGGKKDDECCHSSPLQLSQPPQTTHSR
jgi:hypothetical protein